MELSAPEGWKTVWDRGLDRDHDSPADHKERSLRAVPWPGMGFRKAVLRHIPGTDVPGAQAQKWPVILIVMIANSVSNRTLPKLSYGAGILTGCPRDNPNPVGRFAFQVGPEPSSMAIFYR